MLIGELTKNHLNRILHHLFPDGNSKSFCDAVFRTFSAGDSRSYEYLNFREFLNAMNITSLKSEQVFHWNSNWQGWYFQK